MAHPSQPEDDIPRSKYQLVNGGTVSAFAPYKKGTGCKLQWNVEALYDGPLPCMGEAALLAELNKAAWGLCATIRHDCPKQCPQPAYTPATKLTAYICDEREEHGVLAQVNYNCRCVPKPIT